MVWIVFDGFITFEVNFYYIWGLYYICGQVITFVASTHLLYWDLMYTTFLSMHWQCVLFWLFAVIKFGGIQGYKAASRAYCNLNRLKLRYDIKCESPWNSLSEHLLTIAAGRNCEWIWPREDKGDREGIPHTHPIS